MTSFTATTDAVLAACPYRATICLGPMPPAASLDELLPFVGVRIVNLGHVLPLAEETLLRILDRLLAGEVCLVMSNDQASLERTRDEILDFLNLPVRDEGETTEWVN